MEISLAQANFILQKFLMDNNILLAQGMWASNWVKVYQVAQSKEDEEIMDILKEFKKNHMASPETALGL